MTTDLIDLDAILAKYSADLTQKDIEIFDIKYLLESTDTDVEVDEDLLNLSN